MSDALLSSLIDEAYEKKTWHGPNLRQSIRGVTAKQAAWRPAPGAHNIWELTLHAAYWKYRMRCKMEGGKRGSFAIEGSNFFKRPESGKATESAWRVDRELLDREHRALAAAVRKSANCPRARRIVRGIYGVAFHDVYHAGQIRLLRRLMQKRGVD
jgi:DinB superfamily